MINKNQYFSNTHKNRAILKYKLNNSTLNGKNNQMRTLTMTHVKEDVIAMIQKMPDNVSIIDIMTELYFRQKVDEGLAQLDEGKGISHDEVKERIKKWLS
jgi:hypothetical protein